jgi:mono/diheme cytochrome c family protein
MKRVGDRGQGTGASPERAPETRSQNWLLWIGGYCALPILAIVAALTFLSGCSSVQRTPPLEVWDDMKREGKFKPQMENTIFADHSDSRRPPDGVVARGHLNEDVTYYTGMVGEMYVGKNPALDLALNKTNGVDLAALLDKGHARFNTYCSPCHDRQGSGGGIVPLHVPTWQPANLMEDRVVQFADGEIFNVVTNGRRSMPPYKFQISVEDRWAIIAYLRVLQRAWHASPNDVATAHRMELQ